MRDSNFDIQFTAQNALDSVGTRKSWHPLLLVDNNGEKEA